MKQLLSLLILALPALAVDVVVQDVAGNNLGPGQGITVNAVYGGPENSYTGLYFISGNSSTSSLSILANGDDLQYYTFSGTASCGLFPLACSSVTNGAVIGIDNYSSTLSIGTHTYTIRITNTGSANSPLDIPLTVNIVDRTSPLTFTAPGTITGCTNSNAAYTDDDSCADATWRPDATGFLPDPGDTYTDQNFGSAVRLLCRTCNHEYSTVSPFNQDTTKVKLYSGDIVDADTGTVLVAASGCAWWDTSTSNVCYSMSMDSLSVIKHVCDFGLGSCTTSTLVDLSSEVTTDVFISGGTGDTKQGYLPLYSVDPMDITTSDDYRVCNIRLSDGAKGCASYNPAIIGGNAYTFIDYAIISPGTDSVSGVAYFLLAANGSNAIFTFNPSSGPALTFAYRGGRLYRDTLDFDTNSACTAPGGSAGCWGAYHQDIFEDSNHIQWVLTAVDLENVSVSGRYLVRWKLNSGTLNQKPIELGGGFQILGLINKFGDPILESHNGCAKAAPVCQLSLNELPLTSGSSQYTLPSLVISGATNATPIEITTTTNHGWSTGKQVNIGSVGGNTAANGIWTITVTAVNKFTLDTSVGNGAYTSGGVVGDGDAIADAAHRAEQWVVNCYTEPCTIVRAWRSRTTPYSNDVGAGYWTLPRGAISPDGKKSIADGNYGIPGETFVSWALTGITAPPAIMQTRFTGFVYTRGSVR